ncbi:MAG TPA: rod shape-determining protein MreC, partial [Candidatus Binatia bacterium]|nr:rod shape-determining protein MreC [Candidatus Binatia bacterium]
QDKRMRFIYTKAFRRGFAVFLLVAVLVIADALGYMSMLKSLFHQGFGGTSKALASVMGNTKDAFVVLGTISSLARENAELNQRIDELAFENARLQSAKNENITLRRALNFREQVEYDTIPAEVETMDPTGFSQTVIIDKGEADGVMLGQSVIVPPGLLVGRITKTYRNTSEITLITDPTITINGEVSDSGAHGLVKGEHGTSLILDLVTQNEVIKSGDKIITSGLSGDFPRGLVIGEISAIKTSSSELFQQAFVAPIADLKNLKLVLVIR